MTGKLRLTESQVAALGDLVARDSEMTGLTIDGRYDVREVIGRGGMGLVFLARDLRLDRTVAMKVLNREFSDGDCATRLAEEARTQSRIEHEGIVPIHDFGALPDGRAFYVMKRVEGRTLLDLMRGGVPVARLLVALAEACRIVDFAHQRGVIHRDLKPANIMIDAARRVFVLDWGLASILREGKLPAEASDEIVGTPAYMSPEQARGEVETLDARCDVFALGAILYEILTKRTLLAGADLNTLVRLARSAWPDIVPPRVHVPGIAGDLEAICLKAVAPDREKRHASARELRDDVLRFLEGVRERARRRKLAEGSFRRAKASADRYLRLRERVEAARERLKREEVPGRVVRERAGIWKAQDALRDALLAEAEAWARAQAELASALGHEPWHARARRLKAELEWGRFEEAERDEDEVKMLLHRRAVEQFDDGEFADRLRGDGRLDLKVTAYACGCRRIGRRVQPGELRHLGYHPFSGRALDGRPEASGVRELEPRSALELRVHAASCRPTPVEGAHVWLFRYETVESRLVAVTPRVRGAAAPPPVAAILESLWPANSPVRPVGKGRYLGRTPLKPIPLPMGSWLLVVAHPDFVPRRFPVFIPRSAQVSSEILLGTPSETPDGFVPVAGSPRSFILVGDRRPLESFEIARFPVTCREYADFLGALPPREAVRRAPRETLAAPFWKDRPWGAVKTSRRVPETDAAWRPDWPVLAISWEDAHAYAAWRTRRDRFLYALPHEDEWQCAAEGADGRDYPWGNRFNEPWANTLYTSENRQRPTPVDSFPVDESPWGVRGMAGNVRDLCLNDVPLLRSGRRIARGGAWINNHLYARISERTGVTPDAVHRGYGFRLSCLVRIS